MDEIWFPETCLAPGIEAINVGEAIAFLNGRKPIVFEGGGAATLQRLVALLDGALPVLSIAGKLNVPADSLRRMLAQLHRHQLLLLAVEERQLAWRSRLVGVSGCRPFVETISALLRAEGCLVASSASVGPQGRFADLEVIVVRDVRKQCRDGRLTVERANSPVVVLELDSIRMTVRRYHGQVLIASHADEALKEANAPARYEVGILSAMAALIVVEALVVTPSRGGRPQAEDASSAPRS